jgi:hypothetical protein
LESGIGFAEVGGGKVAELVQVAAGPAGSGAGVLVEQDAGAVVAKPGPAGVRAQVAGRRAGVDIHQLRHAHATELINAGVSIEAVCWRLGHATTHLYAPLNDKVADAEIRAARRRART